MTSQRDMRQWYGDTTGSHRIPLLDLSRFLGLDVSDSGYRIKREFYIHFFFRHRWYHGNRNREEVSLVQSWKSFIGYFDYVGRDAWMNKLLHLAIGLNKSRQPVLGLNFTDCLQRKV